MLLVYEIIVEDSTQYVKSVKLGLLACHSTLY
jgi:hypothetical protein